MLTHVYYLAILVKNSTDQNQSFGISLGLANRKTKLTAGSNSEISFASINRKI